jgi:hypothetical protein
MPIHFIRIPLLALAALAFATPSFASGKTLSFLGGMNISNVTGSSDVFSPKNKLGFVGGVAVGIPVGGRFSIVPEGGYTTRGFSWGTANTVDPSGNVTSTFETLQATQVFTLSCSARMSIPVGGNFAVNVSLGPTVGFESAENFTVISGSTQHKTPDDFLRNTDWGGLAEIGADMKAGPGRAGFGIRYVNGFTDLSRDAQVTRYTRAFEYVASYTTSLGH